MQKTDQVPAEGLGQRQACLEGYLLPSTLEKGTPPLACPAPLSYGHSAPAGISTCSLWAHLPLLKHLVICLPPHTL